MKKSDLYSFKNKYCNENELIIKLIKKKLSVYFKEPILDIGSGMGDIVYHALKDKNVTCLDIKDFKNYPIRDNHIRIHSDYFNFKPSFNYKSYLFAHSLQYLDDNLDKLNSKLYAEKPQNVITITNNNDDFLGELLYLLKLNNISNNAERQISSFPLKYKLDSTYNFTAHLHCPSFDILSSQLIYLTEINNKYKSLIIDYTKSKLTTPKITINQAIKIFKYEK